MDKTQKPEKSAGQKKYRRKRKTRIFLVVLGVLFIACFFFAPYLWRQYDFRFGDAIERNAVIRIAPGTTFEQVNRMMADSGYLTHPSRWEKYARKNKLNEVKPGNYKLTPGMSYRTSLTNLYNGRQTPVRVTFNNIRTMEKLAGTVSKYIEADSLSLLLALSNESLMHEYGYTPQTFPALFIPNTYEVYWTITPEEFVQRMHREHERFWNDERRAKAEKLNLTPLQVSILASIVIEETKVQDEMKDVAGVYINRLRKGWKLDADPTVKFALGDPSIQRVLNVHLKYDSPYNTYIYGGLPPGPIYVPSIQALDAVLDYSDTAQEHSYMFFCANPDFSGRHKFARTLPEHNRNRAAWTAELNRRGIR